MQIMPDLKQFGGTMQYHKLTMGDLKFTDGWEFLARRVNCFWLANIVGSVQHLPKIIEYQSFIVWRIIVKDDKAVVEAFSDCEEGGGYSKDKRLYVQKIPYTDFPKGTFEWYQCGDVVLLKGEY